MSSLGEHPDLVAAEETLGLGPVAVARAMGIPYDTYKDIKNGRRPLKPIHRRVLALLLAVKGTRKGAKFGV